MVYLVIIYAEFFLFYNLKNFIYVLHRGTVLNKWYFLRIIQFVAVVEHFETSFCTTKFDIEKSLRPMIFQRLVFDI